MNVLRAIQSFDHGIYYHLSAFAGNRFLDYFASFEENANFLKGGLFIAFYWFSWISTTAGQRKRRTDIVAILMGAVLALVCARTLADLAPFRLRPMYDLEIRHAPYAIPISINMENWSAFPSDTATLFFALAYGIGRLSRRIVCWRWFTQPCGSACLGCTLASTMHPTFSWDA